MKNILTSILLIITIIGFSQVSDNFEDGDFTNNPEWTGHADRFQVNSNFQLQLNHEGEAATSTLQTINHIVDSVSWEFYIKLSFSPSSNNNARVYLVSDDQNFQGYLNGYFLQFGEAGSSDAIELFKQEGEVVTSICRGNEGSLTSSFNVKMKIEHKESGEWLVYSDFNTSGNYTLECQGNDNSIQTGAYFGFLCKYTSSNATKFYFDDIVVKYLEMDVQAPEVSSLSVIDDNQLKITFSEIVEEETAENHDNYLVNDGIGNPIDVNLADNQLDVVLEFSDDFELYQTYNINVGGIQDLSGNVMPNTNFSFSRTEIKEFDVVINEIMADPTPEVQLPNAEYLEIYNRTQNAIDLSGWILQIGTTDKEFPSAIIAPQSYLILCKTSEIENLSPYGTCVGFSSFALTNAGQSLALISANSEIIHSVSYTEDWYQDAEKDDGGWSIEQINPNDFCSEEENWKASIDDRGGSPGGENSIFNPSDTTASIKSVEVVDNPLLLLTYTQHMWLDHITNKELYSVSPDIGQPNQVIIRDTSKSVYLSFNEPFEHGVEYTLRVHGLLHNCADQGVEVPIERTFMLPKIAIPGDIVINEIMADPEPVNGLPAHEYLELYNITNSPIDLTNWSIQTGTTIREIDALTLAPKSYIIICKNDAVPDLNMYGETFGLSSLSLSNGGAQLVLKNNDGGIIHQVEYSDKWYNDEEKAEGGWSLEMIEPMAYCQEQNNWSASIDHKGGTPGNINSIDDLAPEIEPAIIERVALLNETSIRIYFSHKMDSSSLSVPLYYEIDQGVGNPTACNIEGPKYKTVVLNLAEELQNGIIYTIEIQDGLFECNGNDAGGLNAKFAVPDQIEKGDIVFNEILFDAAIDDGEYLELVNISDKILETADLSISRIKINEYDTSWYTAPLSGQLLFPKDYIAYAQSKTQVERVYYSEAPENIISLNSFPSLPNDEGIVLLHLSSSKDSIIDRLDYSEDWHYSLLNTTKGVSLEKMNLYGGNTQENWHSAASSVNYGTPAYENSQFQKEGETSSSFETYPEVFSPDNDGFDDLLQINYQMKEAGYTLNLLIYDSRGRIIKHLVENELLATSGSFYWDGQDENYQKANMGIYILFFEYFDLNGNVKSEKLTCVLGGKL